MLKSLADLIKVIVKPESDWSKFFQKIMLTLVAGGLGATIWNAYVSYQLQSSGETGVGTVIQRHPERGAEVRELIKAIKDSNRNILSVWVYSWPDARQLIPIMYVGDSYNPVPLGTFLPGDEHAVGAFVLGLCDDLERPFNNYSCPIAGFEDAWGVIVVRYSEGYEITELDRKGVKAISLRAGVILYSTDHTFNLPK